MCRDSSQHGARRSPEPPQPSRERTALVTVLPCAPAPPSDMLSDHSGTPYFSMSGASSSAARGAVMMSSSRTFVTTLESASHEIGMTNS